MSRNHHARRAPLPMARPPKLAGPVQQALVLALADWIGEHAAPDDRLAFWRATLYGAPAGTFHSGELQFMSKVLGPLQPEDAARAEALAAQVPIGLRALFGRKVS